MKYLLMLALSLTTIAASAQYADQAANGTFKLGAGFAKDFPGLYGTAVHMEYNHPMNNFLSAGVGFKYADMSGYPRTETVKEFTKAYSLDFNMFFLPVQTEQQTLRIGGGYSFSFYNIKRSYPVFEKGVTDKATYPEAQSKGRVGGFTAIVEYQHRLGNSPYSLGLRASTFKAYDQVWYAGPFVAMDL